MVDRRRSGTLNHGQFSPLPPLHGRVIVVAEPGLVQDVGARDAGDGGGRGALIPGQDDVDVAHGGHSEERPGLVHAQAAQALPVDVHDLVAESEPPIPEGFDVRCSVTPFNIRMSQRK